MLESGRKLKYDRKWKDIKEMFQQKHIERKVLK